MIAESKDLESTPLGIHCPQCGSEISIQGGLASRVLVRAIHLQAAIRGVELVCANCRTTFVAHTSFNEPEMSSLDDHDA